MQVYMNVNQVNQWKLSQNAKLCYMQEDQFG